MRSGSRVIASGVVALVAGLFSFPTDAATLDERRSEWAFDLSAIQDTEDASSINLRFSWGHIVGRGYAEWGATAAYLREDDTNEGSEVRKFKSVGGFYTWHWTPRSERATGFLTLGLAGVGGDTGGADYSIEGDLGMKFFFSRTAAVRASYFARSFRGFGDAGESQRFDGIIVGIALFTGLKG